jgi:hypothetical protein
MLLKMQQTEPRSNARTPHLDALLDEALEESFPASDPIAVDSEAPRKASISSRLETDKAEHLTTGCIEAHHHQHPHRHGPDCGHTAVRHDGHADYLHDGHLHHMHGDHVDEHVIEISAGNPSHCVVATECSDHKHGRNCGHEAVPHATHIDYLVKGQLHHPHGVHCDVHGAVQFV